jgi:hypothetical protein
MKSRLSVTWLLLAILFSTAHAQTLSDIEKKYGTPVRAYSASEHIWVRPEFGGDGQLCMVRLYPKQIDAGNNYLWDKLPLWEVKEVFDQIAPAEVRGKRKADLVSFQIGGMGFSGVEYEHVRINFTTPLTSRRLDRAASSVTVADDKEFPDPWGQSAQIVTISWLNRKCADK